MDEVKLYRKNALGLGTWRVYHLPITSKTQGTVIIAHASVEGGSEITHSDPVHVNQSGRNIQQQIDLEMQARISRQMDKGYKTSREEALKGSTNQMGLVNPMLAQKITDVRLTQSMLEHAYVQPKFDGHRCLITKLNGDMLAYSRRGKAIETVSHILEDAYKWMQDGDTLDGELYVHGQSLQSISSLIKRDQAGSRALCYHWYDIVDPKRVFHDRWNVVKDLHANSQSPQIKLVPTNRVHKMAEVYTLFGEYRKLGYEGAMLRVSTAGYETAKRSAQLLKVKERHDCEVIVIGMRASSQGWAILRCRMPNQLASEFDGPEFDISAPGSVPEKTEVLQNPSKYIGRKLTIEYANLTAEGIPFHAVATRWHEEL
jgi:DNA ligase 1